MHICCNTNVCIFVPATTCAYLFQHKCVHIRASNNVYVFVPATVRTCCVRRESMKPQGGGAPPADSELAAAITRDFGSQQALEEVRVCACVCVCVCVSKVKDEVSVRVRSCVCMQLCAHVPAQVCVYTRSRTSPYPHVYILYMCWRSRAAYQQLKALKLSQ